MKVTIYGKSANDPKFMDMLIKFAIGVETVGDEIFLSYDEEYHDCDVAVIFGSWKDRPDTHHKVKNSIVNNAKNFIVIETPLIGRGPVSNVMQDDWYRIGLNGFLADTGNFNNKHKARDRWNIVRKGLDITIPAYHMRKGPIVIALQLPGDASLKGISVEQWALDTIKEIRTETDRDIIVRTPQLERSYDQKIMDEMSEQSNVQFQRGTKENLIPTLHEALCTVTYSSGLAIDSLLNGCPNISMSPSSFAYEIVPNTVKGIEDIRGVARDQWLHNLAYAQWHVNEIEQGLPWLHLKKLLEKET